MDIYDKNVIDHLNISPDICSVADARAVHQAMIELRTRLALVERVGEFFPHYRSEQYFGWDITPGLFRGPGARFSPQQGKDLERQAVADYEQMVITKLGSQVFRDLFDHHPNGKKWDLLFQAQHCGLRTSLVDWTMYIMPSLFFGIEESKNLTIENADGQVWAFMVNETQLLTSDVHPPGDNYLNHDPFNLTRGFMTNVPVYLDNLEERICEQRISRQGGRFWASSNASCNIPVNKQPDVAPQLFRFRIPASCKLTIRKELDKFGINHANTYVKESADHDSIAKAINQTSYGF